MIITNDSDFGNSYSDEKFFIKNYYKINPIKKITIFFDYENFLLTNYKTSVGTTFVAEGWNGNEIHLTGLNCGYAGTGPSKTADILYFLGMQREQANDLKFKAGLQIDFSENGNIDKITDDLFFSSQTFPCKVHLCDYTKIEFESRKLYFINPQIHAISDVYNIIDELHPYEFQYFIGSDSPLNNGVPPNIIYNFPKKDLIEISGVNLILKCKKMTLLFLIDRRIARSFVDIIYFYLTGKPLFDDNEFILKYDSKFLSYIFSIFKHSKKKELHGSLKIDRKGN